MYYINYYYMPDRYILLSTYFIIIYMVEYILPTEAIVFHVNKLIQNKA